MKYNVKTTKVQQRICNSARWTTENIKSGKKLQNNIVQHKGLAFGIQLASRDRMSQLDLEAVEEHGIDNYLAGKSFKTRNMGQCPT